MTELKVDNDHYEFAANFTEISNWLGKKSDTLETFIVSADYDQTGTTERVWIDTYGREIHDGRMTTYSFVNADDAEAIGLALIHAAKVARGEVKHEL